MKINTKDFRVKPGTTIKLDTLPTEVKPVCESKKEYKKLLKKQEGKLSDLQRVHYASGRYALLLIFQTTWETITLTLDDSGKVVALDLPHLKTTPHKAFCIVGFQTLEELLKKFPTIGSPKGTEFQRAVWNELKKIPRGQTRTYGEIAAAIGRPKAVRAVGSACGANPIPLWIPCHRVVAKNGLGGFGCGLPWKKLLLELEGWNEGTME